MRMKKFLPLRLCQKFNSKTMSRINLQKEFLNLRLQGFSLSKIAEALGISLITAKRWNKILSSNINHDDESVALRKQIIEKQKEYFEFLDNTFISIKSEILKYDAPRMPYDKLIVSAMKILNAINKMSSVRPSFSENFIASIADDCENDSNDNPCNNSEYNSKDNLNKKSKVNLKDNPENDSEIGSNDTTSDTKGIKTQVPINHVHILRKRKNDTAMIPKK